MNRIIICFILFLNTTFIFSQNEYQKSVDSLLVLINNEVNAGTKINQYQALCDIYFDYDIRAFKKYNQVLLSIATKQKLKKGLGFYYCNQAKLVSLQDSKKAVFFAKKTCSIFFDLKDWDNYIYANYLLSNNLIVYGEIKENINILKNTIKIAEKSNSKYSAHAYVALSNAYTLKGEYNNAFIYANKALNLKNQILPISVIHNCISNTYRRFYNYNKAIEYNDIAIKNAKNPKNLHEIFITRIHLFCENNRSSEAITLAKNSLKFYKSQGDYIGEQCMYYYLAFAYFNLEDYVNAKFYLNLYTIPLNKENQIDRYTFKAEICMYLEDYKSSLLNINKALELVNDDVSFGITRYAYITKVEIEKKLKNYKEALRYQKKITKLLWLNYEINNKNKTNFLATKLEVTQKNNIIKNLQISQLKKQIELNSKNNYLNYSIVGIIVLGLIVLYFIYSQKIIRNKNYLIGTANTNLELEKNKTVKSLLEKETLLKEIHHRVKNNMQLVISLLKIQARDTKQLSIENFIEISENRIRSMALIHEYLYESENINYVNFEDYIKRLSSSLLSSFSGQNDIKIETEIENAHFDIETSIPLGLIINELVINAFKHAFVGKDQGTIKIQLFEKEGLQHLVVSDNGVGIANNNENSASIGLKIVKLLVSQIGGVMEIKNNLGTSFTIQFTNNNNTNE